MGVSFLRGAIFLGFIVSVVAADVVASEPGENALELESRSGAKYSCLKSHSRKIADGIENYYGCHSSLGTAILYHRDSVWFLIEKETSEKPLKIQGGFSVLSGKKIVFVKNEQAALESNYEDLSWLMGFLNSKSAATADYEKMSAAFSSEATERRKSLFKRDLQSERVTVTLSDNRKVACTRGKYRFPTVKEMNDPGFKNPACDLYFCGDLSTGSRVYSALLTYPPNEEPFLSLTNGELLGPENAISRIDNTDSGKSVFDSSNKEPWQYGHADRSEQLSEVIPEEFQKAGQKILDYLSPDWRDTRSKQASRCEQSEIDRLLRQEAATIENTKTALGTYSTLQILRLVNKELKSDIILKSALPPGACQLSERAYISPEAVDPFRKLEKTLSCNFDGSVTLAEGNRIFSEVASMKDLPFKYIDDGCASRAHVIAARLAKSGIKCEKAWITGDLFPRAHPDVTWYYHVAPVIRVKDKNGNIQKMTIDPALSPTLITLEKWLSLVGSRARGNEETERVSFPPPMNSYLYGRKTVSFSDRSVFHLNEITKRDPVVDMTEAEKKNAQYLQLQSTEKKDGH